MRQSYLGYQKDEELQLTLGVERVKGMVTQIERDERFLMVFIFSIGMKANVFSLG